MIFFGDIDLLQSFIDANALVKGDQICLAAIISNPILLKRNSCQKNTSSAIDKTENPRNSTKILYKLLLRSYEKFGLFS